jgi:hypothetical protein
MGGSVPRGDSIPLETKGLLVVQSHGHYIECVFYIPFYLVDSRGLLQRCGGILC